MSQMQIKTSCDGGSKSRDEKVFTFCQNGQCCSTSPLLFLNENCKEKNYYETTEIGECAKFKFAFDNIEGNVTYLGFPSHMDVKLSFKDGSRYDMVCSLFDSKKLEGNVTNGPKFLNFSCKGMFFGCRTSQPQTFQPLKIESFNPCQKEKMHLSS